MVRRSCTCEVSRLSEMQSFVDKEPDQHTTMNDESVIRVTAAELSTLQDVTDWDRVYALTDAQIEQAILRIPMLRRSWTRSSGAGPNLSILLGSRAAKRRDR